MAELSFGSVEKHRTLCAVVVSVSLLPLLPPVCYKCSLAGHLKLALCTDDHVVDGGDWGD
jgi:hypothetical protein